eukprot:gene11941-15050_t
MRPSQLSTDPLSSKKEHAGAGLWNVNARLKEYKIVKEQQTVSADLRQRNIKWYLKSMSPQAAFLKKCKKAEEAARQRRPLPLGKKATHKKTSWFGGADVPTRPELNSTSPLVLAVRLGRISCVQALLKHSPSINIPDGFGVTPIQYALFLLLKDRHNKVVQQITDLILSHLPFTSSHIVASMYMLPRTDFPTLSSSPYIQVVQQITDTILSHLPFASSRAMASMYLLPRAEKALANARKAGTQLKDLANFKEKVLALKNFQPVNHPNFMDPMVLATLLNDMPRLAWLVFRCAGNLNDSYVALPDIPTYLQGQWEKMAGNCRSKVLPLHVGVMQKKLETVRLMLDMGADPNTFGVEYCGNLKKDIERRRSLFREKSQVVKDQIEAGASAIPYARLWTNPAPGMLNMLSGHNFKKVMGLACWETSEAGAVESQMLALTDRANIWPYQHLDMTSDPKDYKKYTLRLDSQFNQQYMNTSLEFFLPAYFMPVLRKHIAVVGGDHPSSGRNMSHDAMKKGAAELYQGYIMSQVQSQKERLVRACYVSSRPKRPNSPKAESHESRSKAESDASKPSPDLAGHELQGWARKTAATIKANADSKYSTLEADRARGGELSSAAKSSLRLKADSQAFAEWCKQAAKTLIDLEPEFQAMAKKVNAGMLPKWYVDHPGKPDSSPEETMDMIASSVASFNPSGEVPKDFSGLDASNDFLGQLADETKGFLETISPKFDMELLEEKKRSPEDLTVADSVKALQIAYIEVKSRESQAILAERMVNYAAGAEEFQAKSLANIRLMVEQKRQMMTKKVEALSSGDLAFDEDALFAQAMHQVNWEIIGKKLGPNGPNIVSLLTSIDPPLNSTDVLALAKNSVGEGMEALFLDKLKQTGKAPPAVADALSDVFKGGTDETPVDAVSDAVNAGTDEAQAPVDALSDVVKAGTDETQAPADAPSDVAKAGTDEAQAPVDASSDVVKAGTDDAQAPVDAKGMQMPEVMAFAQVCEDVERFDASSVAKAVLDKGGDLGGDFGSKLIAPVPGMKSRLANNPLAAELLQVSANNQLDQVREFYSKKLETVEFDMVSNATCGMEEMTSLTNLGHKFEQALANILDNLEAEGEHVIDEMTLGFQLDLLVDLEGLAAAMQGAQDALLMILDFLDIDHA